MPDRPSRNGNGPTQCPRISTLHVRLRKAQGAGRTLGITESACDRCRRIVPAKITSDGRDVYFEKFCPEHGDRRVLVRRDLDDYLESLRYVKPAWIPREHRGRSDAPCPEGCGLCDRHEQHLCMPIVEITSRCDLSCPVCLVDAGRPWDMSLDEFRRILDGLIRAERQIDVLNLSGGEPLVHPELRGFPGRGPCRPEIVRVSISTNGLAPARAAGPPSGDPPAACRRLAPVRRFRRSGLPVSCAAGSSRPRSWRSSNAWPRPTCPPR